MGFNGIKCDAVCHCRDDAVSDELFHTTGITFSDQGVISTRQITYYE